MASPADHVRRAIDRWQEKGLVDPDTARRLRAESEMESRSGERRWSQYALGSTGAILLIIAGSVFFSWIWPSFGSGGQSIALAGIAVLGFGVGRAMERRDRWIPAAYMLQAAGLALLLISTAYSEEAWPEATAGGMIAGLVAAAAPILALIRSHRRNSVLPPIEVTLGYMGVVILFQRATGIPIETTLWIVDAVLIASLAGMALRLRSARAAYGSMGSVDTPSRASSSHSRMAPEDAIPTEEQSAGDWVRNAFLVSLFCGLPLAFVTATESLDVGADDAAFALDVWLAVIAVLSLWTVRLTRSGSRLEHRLITYCLLIAIVLAFWTLEAALSLDALATAAGLAGVGILGFAYALPRSARGPTLASCLAVVIGAWYYGVTEAGTLGVVAALAFSAIVLFVISASLGWRGEAEVRT